ncbi:MAG TPA: hypothetical protein VKR32_01965 [Puia sp.]|nr:hypothetical protein [Puia sp.]
MNNTFDFRRFGFLFRKTLLERPVQLFGFTGLIFAVIFITYFICKMLIGIGPAQNISFIWGMAGGGCFLASFLFSYFSTSASGSSYLTLPASSFEKWLCGVIIAEILYPLLFLVFFRGIDTMFVTIYHNSLDPASPLYKSMFDSVFIFAFDGRVAEKVYQIFFLLTGIGVVGSLYFNKVNFIKTALVFCVVCFAAWGINWLMAIIIFGHINDAFPFHGVDIPVGKIDGSVDLPAIPAKIYNVFSDLIFPISLWLVSFVRLKEKEF